MVYDGGMTNTTIPAGTWNIDPTHSTVGFVARHLVISKVRGSFRSFSGAIIIGAQQLDSSVSVSIDMASVDTADESRDGHIKGEDFFDVATFPTMTFTSTKLTQEGEGFEVTGDLTIKGVTRSVILELEFNGVSKDPWGGTRAGFSAETEINRKDFGLEWNVVMETGGVLVGEKIKIELDIQAVQA
jgi:polyisoprenoid-binding protein YceI